MWRLRRLLLPIVILVAVSAFAQEQVHVLKQGETIYTLARRYGVESGLLLSYNRIADPTRLPVGARIVIPGTYVVQDGEYIYSIARKLGLDWQELLRTNNIGMNDVVRPGDVLLVPMSPSSMAEAERPSGDGQTGDTERTATASGTAADVWRDSDAGDERNPIVSGPAVARNGGSAGAEQLQWPHPGDREPWDGKFRGVVMRGEPGDVFQSVTSGVVTFVGPFTSFGKLILVQGLNGYLYGYAGADRVDVVQGQRVEAGTVLGSVGISPAFRSARVLFTVWRNNRYVDPESAPRG